MPHAIVTMRVPCASRIRETQGTSILRNPWAAVTRDSFRSAGDCDLPWIGLTPMARPQPLWLAPVTAYPAFAPLVPGEDIVGMAVRDGLGVIVLAHGKPEYDPGKPGERTGRPVVLESPVTLFLPDPDGDHDGGDEDQPEPDDRDERECPDC